MLLLAVIGSTISFAALHLCCYSVKAAKDKTDGSGAAFPLCAFSVFLVSLSLSLSLSLVCVCVYVCLCKFGADSISYWILV